MSRMSKEDALKKANLRLCQIRDWPDYGGLGFELLETSEPPQIIKIVDSNSPAAAGGLKIYDVILAINKEDMTSATKKDVGNVIRSRDKSEPIDLLVIERRRYDELKTKQIIWDPKKAKIMTTPVQMPFAFRDFPENTPRVCKLSLKSAAESLGLDTVEGENGIGVFIQEVTQGSPADNASLRKSDRVIEINGEYVEDQPYKDILKRITDGKVAGALTLYVMDTKTYKSYKKSGKSLRSRDNPNIPSAPPSYVNVNQNATESSDEEEIPQPPVGNKKLTIDKRGSDSDDIRLCTITRADAKDSFGFKLQQDDKKSYFYLQLQPGPNNKPSNAGRAGIKENDRLIEVNGKNIEKKNIKDVKELIKNSSNAYPAPLELLVVNAATYNSYKKKKKDIHKNLKNVQKLPPNRHDQSAMSDELPTDDELTNKPPNKGIIGLGINNPLQPAQRQRHELKRGAKDTSYGFTVAYNETGDMRHQISAVTKNSPAEKSGLHVDDYILTVNKQDVQNMSKDGLKEFLKSSSKEAEERGKPLLIETTKPDSSPDVSISPPDISESYPEMRCCTIDYLVQDSDLGFEIKKSSSKYDGYQIKNLKKGSSADLTNVRNDDYIIEVEGVNIENRDYSGVKSVINDTFKNESEITLLVIDPIGYEWYKTRKYPINSSSIGAKVKRCVTPARAVLPSSTTNKVPIIHTTPPPSPTPQLLRHPSIHSTTSNTPIKPNVHDPSVHITDPRPPITAPDNRPINGNRIRSFKPRDPLPRKCVLISDSSFPGCGFRILENENYDTPIIAKVEENSPAKRSGLTEGDHIIYVDSKNVQKLRSFNKIKHLIQRTFEENGQVTLEVLTSSGYEVWKRRGGFLDKDPFDYQSITIQEMKPRFRKLTLRSYEHDFGFKWRREIVLTIGNVQLGSAADANNIKKDDIILELNGKDTKTLSKDDIKEILELSKQQRSLEVLVIDKNGYQYSIDRAIPLNSLLPFVQKDGGVNTTDNNEKDKTFYL